MWCLGRWEMNYQDFTELVEQMRSKLLLSERAQAGCRNSPDRALFAGLIGWNVMLKYQIGEPERKRMQEA
ncbi:hypothetical protein DZC52_06175 [Wenzhouxiangella sediminis]|uniref:Uncharacterized protein n=1 Tax=Wenzhouxiangella sediminis TaxID=1792836 RepID=A0A3E1K9M7_9GAMM|nr:hypothetical protein DZC52_06175 [Wenzhouxiangella sediminis]